MALDMLKNFWAELSRASIKNMATQKYTVAKTLAFKYAPITSLDADEVFHEYKRFPCKQTKFSF